MNVRSLIIVALLFSSTPYAIAQDVPEVASPYDEAVDTIATLDQALARARRADRPALLVFGANWCDWCRRLKWVMQNDAGVRAELLHFEVVDVRVGSPREPSYQELERRYSHDPLSSLPTFVVVFPDG